MHTMGITAATATAAPASGASMPQPRLVRAAHEFEAQMMKELLKPMTSASELTGGEEDDAISGSTGALGEFASEALGRALSEHGGFGIADSIVQNLSQSGNSTEPAKVTEKMHRNTILKKPE
jgi:Rod binding domain-containing protein